MASVSSLDADMRKLRMDRYTPQAANEVKQWIESTLKEPLPAGDLLDSLKDGVALCKLANMVLGSPGIRFKQSNMPFVQRENIAHFLTACENHPLNMPSHDRFLTVDLYDRKDPAQVLQCIQAFSRTANAVNQSRFPEVIGPRKGVTSPARNTGSNGMNSYETTASRSPEAARALSPTLSGGSGVSRSTTSASGTSSWSRKTDQGVTAPAWNIAQYGYMGGASQGNQGISFGARRQIMPTSVDVPNREEKVRLRQEREAEEERRRLEEDRRRKAEIEAQEEQAKLEEERRWEEETRQKRDRERAAVEAEKRKWEEQERKWRLEEEQRKKEEEQVQKQSSGLHGQFLSEYQAEQSRASKTPEKDRRSTSETDRIRDLERQLEEAKERERKYLEGRESTPVASAAHSGATTAATATQNHHGPTPVAKPPPAAVQDEFEVGDERDFLRQQKPAQSPNIDQNRPLPNPRAASPSRPLPTPASTQTPQKADSVTEGLPLSSPSSIYSAATPPSSSRTDRFLASNPAPAAATPQRHVAPEMTSMNERAEEDRRRVESQQNTKAGGWASKSLLEREMERERERQREWEEQQIKKGRLTGPRPMR